MYFLNVNCIIYIVYVWFKKIVYLDILSKYCLSIYPGLIIIIDLYGLAVESIVE